MLHSIFGSNRPVVMTLLIVPALAAGVLATIFGHATLDAFAGPLFDVLYSYFEPYNWLQVALGLVVILANAALLNGVTNRHNYSHVEHFFPVLVYFFFSISDVNWIGLNAVQFANLFILLALRRLLTVYRVGSPTAMLFDAGIFLGLAVLFFPLAVFAVPLLWLGLMQLRSFNLREWLVPAVGIATPAFYSAIWYWWKGYTLSPDEFFIAELGDIGIELAGKMWYVYVFFGASLVVSMAGFYQFFSDMNVSTVHRKNTKSVFLWYAFLVVLIVFYGSGLRVDYGELGLLFAPLVAVFMGVFYIGTRRVVLLRTALYIWLLSSVVSLFFSLSA